MLLISLVATILTVLTPQDEPDIDALLAPAMTPNDVAAFCFAPANRRAGERDRECQYRVLREDPARVARIDGLRQRCDRQAALPLGGVDACVRQILTDQRAAAEAERVERAAAQERVRTGEALFDDLFLLEPAPVAAPPPPAPPPARRGADCRRETTPNPDGAGGTVTWVCGNDDGLANQVRDALRPR